MNRGMVLTQQDPNGPGAIKSLVDTIQKVIHTSIVIIISLVCF